MALPSRRLSLVKDGIEVFLGRLSALPSSPEVENLRLKAEEFLREVLGGSVSPPAAEERKLMERAFTLHTEIAKLETRAPRKRARRP